MKLQLRWTTRTDQVGGRRPQVTDGSGRRETTIKVQIDRRSALAQRFATPLYLAGGSRGKTHSTFAYSFKKRPQLVIQSPIDFITKQSMSWKEKRRMTVETTQTLVNVFSRPRRLCDSASSRALPSSFKEPMAIEAA